ncbi:hypothetical protein ACFYW1_34160 [Streptomyces sp. NPDC002669]|uniref:hypothetical protein n=1 Tax=Streptomyces sp. NPDC002669 TaxID=3364658 RepID=UPI00367FF1AD
MAMELAGRRQKSEPVAQLRERERIFYDPFGIVIQRLFASGADPQGVQPLVKHPEAAERLARTRDDLDTTIRIIRSVIFGLHASGESPDDRERSPAPSDVAPHPAEYRGQAAAVRRLQGQNSPR